MKKIDITRKIVNSLCMLMCTITAFLFITFFISDSKNEAEECMPTPLPTPEIKINGHKIVIDAGHGGKDGGAVGVGGTIEAELNLEVAKELQSLLLQQGFEVIMTRENEDALGATKMEDMKKRREIMNTDGVDAVVSIHMNIFNCSHMM